MIDRRESPRRLSVVVDNPSWVLPWAETIVARRRQAGDFAELVRRFDDVVPGDVALFLGCVGICAPAVLSRNLQNLVIHESDLPRGRGFAPMTWQVLEGKNDIPVCLIEASDEADAGPVLLRRWLRFEGHELIDEMRQALGQLYCDMMDWYFEQPARPRGEPQVGTPTRYGRRRPRDSRIDPNRTIAEQFDLLRVVDDLRYPAFFEHRGRIYRLRIDKLEELPGTKGK